MPATQSRLKPADAAELAETLTFVSEWLTGPDHTELAASFSRFVGTQGYDLAELRSDLARFACLLDGTGDGSSFHLESRSDG